MPMSGARTRSFTEGWAKGIGTWGKAHYYVRQEMGMVVSMCGGSGPGLAGRLLAPGTWPLCKRCEKMAPATPVHGG